MRTKILLLMVLFMLGVSTAFAEPHSALWGKDGAGWSPDGRLPDFSYAGYRHGEASLPTPPVTHNVRDFGAVGDGKQDDSEAFLRAISEAPAGVILVPAGRYVITKMLVINKPNLVLRGEGPDKTILHFPTPLNTINPNWGATTSGQRTSNYSWSGGFISIGGSFQRSQLTPITAPAKRGQNTIEVADASMLSVGREVEIRQQDNAENSLANHLYSGDPRIGTKNLKGRVHASLVSRITAIAGNHVTLERPLRFDVSADWKPAVYRFAPTVTESGIENMRFDFPNTPYGGHFSELGYNAFRIGQAAHCWVRNIHIHNADSGGFISGMFNTVDGVVYTSERKADENRKSTGHHGVTNGGADNLITNFDFQAKFIHDLTVSGSQGNVHSDGRGVDLALDHHCHAPYENLFTNIHAGAGTRTWQSGGGRDLGAHCGARGTFWNIRANDTITPPSENFGPWSMNHIGVQMGVPDNTDPEKRWYEHSTADGVQPENLHQAQLKRRLGLRK
jgi:hypothetical protein